MSIVELSNLGGCSPNTWTKVERGGYVHPSSYEKIAAGLRVPTELVAQAAESGERLTELVDLLGAGANYFPDPSTLDDRALWDALDALKAEVYARFWMYHDDAAAGRDSSPRRPRVRTRAANDEPAALDGANRTEQERSTHHGMG
jgi:hypothetical protein